MVGQTVALLRTPVDLLWFSFKVEQIFLNLVFDLETLRPVGATLKRQIQPSQTEQMG